jgi:hypothetical protein
MTRILVTLVSEESREVLDSFIVEDEFIEPNALAHEVRDTIEQKHEVEEVP